MLSRMNLDGQQQIVLRQRKELAELMGVETRNKFEILGARGEGLGFAAEQGHGLGASLARMFMGHWRTFELHIFDAQRNLHLIALHPFRFFFQRLEIRGPEGQLLGALQQRFSILTKRFDVEDQHGRQILSCASPLWKPWTFPFQKDGREVATVKKRWSGLLKEAFTDTDNFLIEFTDPSLSAGERNLLLAAGLFIDLQYFEKRAQS
jgi:uncharacterized protein YxjI